MDHPGRALEVPGNLNVLSLEGAGATSGVERVEGAIGDA
jgi:hypothetical protein